jgi:NAD(P)-dependent dehydrogenase (short-subunit alcohol dehydrogenase family)
MLGFSDPISAVVVGGQGGVGGAFVSALLDDPRARVWTTSREPAEVSRDRLFSSRLDVTDEHSIEETVRLMGVEGFEPNLILNCSGVLHSKGDGPERTWRHLDRDVMRRVFDVNTFGVALLGKHLIPLFPREERCVFVSLSARVGSIADNRLGGWYSYRASKAAQNMIIKGLAIEAKKRWPGLVCVALHPGTVRSKLSEPFTSKMRPEQLFTPEQSCAHLAGVIGNLRPEDSGNFYAWDGQAIPY